MNRLPPRVLAALLLAGLVSCAVPQPPTGGPQDQTPPEVVSSEPSDASVRVRPSSVRLIFSEYVDRTSLEQAVSVLPPFQEPLEFDWDGRAVEIVFPAPLRENTTYVIELGTRLEDVHGVALDRAVRVAFSTGATIFSHRLTGRLVDAGRGRPVSGYAILAYPVAPSTSVIAPTEAAPYRTQTGENGRFELSYLPDSTFFLLALQDQNRNRRPDRGEAFAAPPSVPLASREQAAPNGGVRLVAARVDTASPRLLAHENLSRRRTRLRFSEPVRLLRRHGPPMTRAAPPSTEVVPSFYRRIDSPNLVWVETPAVPAGAYRLPLSGVVADTSTNPVRDTTLAVEISAREDTVGVRLLEIVPPEAERPAPYTRPPGFRFNRPVDSVRLSERAAVADSTGRVVDGNWTTETGTLYEFAPRRPTALSGSVRVRLDGRLLGRDTTYADSIAYLPESVYGSLTGTMTGPNGPRDSVRLRLRADGEEAAFEAHAQTDSTGRFAFERVPEGTYVSRFYLDENGDAHWNGGTLHPYHPPEKIDWLDSVRVRARWDTELEEVRLGTSPALDPDPTTD